MELLSAQTHTDRENPTRDLGFERAVTVSMAGGWELK